MWLNPTSLQGYMDEHEELGICVSIRNLEPRLRGTLLPLPQLISL